MLTQSQIALAKAMGMDPARAFAGNPELMQKSAMELADLDSSASLSHEDADRFINLVVDESVLLKSIRVHRTNSPSGDISKLNISTPVTEKATENNDSGNTSKPTNTVVSYATVKTRSAIDITGEVQEDNIEGPGGRNTIMGVIVNRIANDNEQLSIEGDSSITGNTAEQRLLKSNDGFNILMSAANGSGIVNAGGFQASDKLLSKMLRLLPTRYRKNKSNLRWIMSSNTLLSLQDEWAARLTDQGDAHRSGDAPMMMRGIRILEVPLMPEDLTLSGTDMNAGTIIYLCDPQNLIYVVQRQLTVEWERVPRSDRDEGTIHMRTDFLIEDAAGCVKAVNVDTESTTAYYGASA